MHQFLRNYYQPAMPWLFICKSAACSWNGQIAQIGNFYNYWSCNPRAVTLKPSDCAVLPSSSSIDLGYQVHNQKPAGQEPAAAWMMTADMFVSWCWRAHSLQRQDEWICNLMHLRFFHVQSWNRCSKIILWHRESVCETPNAGFLGTLFSDELEVSVSD